MRASATSVRQSIIKHLTHEAITGTSAVLEQLFFALCSPGEAVIVSAATISLARAVLVLLLPVFIRVPSVVVADLLHA
jgi:hypothetical protein